MVFTTLELGIEEANVQNTFQTCYRGFIHIIKFQRYNSDRPSAVEHKASVTIIGSLLYFAHHMPSAILYKSVTQQVFAE